MKKVKMVLNEDDVHRHLARIHEQIQMSYSKWMVRFCYEWRGTGLNSSRKVEIELRTNAQVGVLEGRFRVFEDNLARTLSSMESGIRQLHDDRRKKFRVSPSGDDTQGSNNIVKVWICSSVWGIFRSANKND